MRPLRELWYKLVGRPGGFGLENMGLLGYLAVMVVCFWYIIPIAAIVIYVFYKGLASVLGF